MTRSELATPADVTRAYGEFRSRYCELLRTLPETTWSATVPACPAWTVTELSAHVVGVVDDILAGRLEGVASEPWTAAQVARLGHETPPALADRFEATAPTFDPMIEHIPAPTNSQLVLDAVTHEHDLRGAVGLPGARDSLGVSVALRFMLHGLSAAAPAALDTVLDVGLPEFELLRALTGRRSATQLAAAGLDAAALAPLLGGPLRLPDATIEE